MVIEVGYFKWEIVFILVKKCCEIVVFDMDEYFKLMIMLVVL